MKIVHGKLLTDIRKVLLGLFLCVLFLFFLPVSAFSGVQYTVFCPAASDVLIGFEWRSTVNIVVASNSVSVSLPETPTGLYSQFYIPAINGGAVILDMSSGIMRNFSCVEIEAVDTAVFTENMLTGLAGLLGGSMFAWVLIRYAI
ncbi:MAG: hypothetical protein A3I04_01275 [Nitrospinae bacterium RIFCSPLOWO2_02_FULL_39_110]|nr:MAG: hypothetical protein A3D20_03575 [Nitrospinae bacterium RIFCSPHIGHO2_02_FULL_39_82]OGW03996.1 MAG: hypothetical protein A3I04_01275 [Nitrospinae bacterium RIFCSPLOWO2_02_FULL_39_110]